uniref:Ig-like domain-containing protein n=1 Tax=Chelonoidis abingdonii TaxID=106734 RepID=A0A8C0IXF9_CHEAB
MFMEFIEIILKIILKCCKETEVAAIAGESVQLLPLKLPESWTEITWEVTLDSAETYGIVTFHKGEPPDHGSTPHFINRVTFHPDNLSLQIDPVKKSDSGLYSLQTETGGGRIDITKFRVSVFRSLLSDRVRQPNLTVLSAHPELGQCSVTLFCSVPGADRVTYSWSRGTSWIPSDRDQQLPGNRSLLHVVINADSSDVFYRCNASNRASWAADAADVNPLCNSPEPDCIRSAAGFLQKTVREICTPPGGCIIYIPFSRGVTRSSCPTTPSSLPSWSEYPLYRLITPGSAACPVLRCHDAWASAAFPSLPPAGFPSCR